MSRSGSGIKMEDDGSIRVGDVVCYTSAFLRSIGDYSADSADDTATVIGIGKSKPVMVRLKWRNGDEGSGLITNYIRVDRKHLEPR